MFFFEYDIVLFFFSLGGCDDQDDFLTLSHLHKMREIFLSARRVTIPILFL